MTMTIREDFGGAGGMALGLRQAGFAGRIVSVEWVESAVRTSRAAGHETIHADVRAVPADAFGPLLGYTAGPPCQTFSQAGSRKGVPALSSLVECVERVADGESPEDAVTHVHDDELDERTVLALHPLTVIRDARPKFVILEQVKAVLPLWEAYATVMREMGYVVRVNRVRSEQYGVPQARIRGVLSAVHTSVLDTSIEPDLDPVPTHSKYYSHNPSRLDEGVLPWVTMAEALNRGLTSRPAFTVMGGGTATGGAEPFGNASRKAMFRAQDAGEWQWEPTAEVEGDTSWVYRRPSPTIVGSFRPDVIAAPGYRKPGDPPRQKTPGSVRATPQECGILQSFPADYPWQGTRGQQHQQAGNAIPPLMAAAIAKPLLALTGALENTEEEVA